MFKKVLVPIDLQDPAGAKRSLTTVAEYSSDDVELHLMSVLPGYQMPMVASYFPKEAVAKALSAMKQELKTLAGNILGDREFSVEVCEGKAHQAIVKHAGEIGADLIIIGAQKHGAVEKMMLGTVTAKVTERAKCSVLVLKS
ncbi:universal stress protein [Neptuniibacter halophilus]|uniref:universal stress protein n=1 Tax=Neptuniibacter halophilus TaxID=651666 RepID=UPI0025732653|nr:universal stress protein [Neptuniibacter halophilus]